MRTKITPPSYDEAKDIIRQCTQEIVDAYGGVNVQSFNSYRRSKKADPDHPILKIPSLGAQYYLKLACTPEEKSKISWGDLLGNGRRKMLYSKVSMPDFIMEARQIAQAHGLLTAEELRQFAKENPDLWPTHLPASFFDYYPDLRSHHIFPDNEKNNHLKNANYLSFPEFLKEVRKYNYATAKDYDQVRMNHPRWPSHPDRTFEKEYNAIGKWVGLLNLPKT